MLSVKTSFYDHYYYYFIYLFLHLICDIFITVTGHEKIKMIYI